MKNYKSTLFSLLIFLIEVYILSNFEFDPHSLTTLLLVGTTIGMGMFCLASFTYELLSHLINRKG